MGTGLYLGSCLAFCLAMALCGATIPDEHVDQILSDTETEVREWFEHKPTPPGYANYTTRSYRKRAPIAIHELGVRTAIFAHAADRLAKRFEITKDEADVILQTRASQRPGFNANDICNRRAPDCTQSRNSRFRNIDGTCNNLRDPTLGMAVVKFDRFLPPVYADGSSTFRRSSTTNEDLLSPRIVRLIIHPEVNRVNNLATHMVVGFGQFLDHDITSTPENQNLQCCTNRNNPECMPILVPVEDRFYSQFGVQCIDIARSVRACGTGPREQINQATAFIDGSQIYGNSKQESDNLRFFTNGLLQTDTNNNRLLPKDNQVQNCGIPQQGITCFRAGDDRLNENPGLTSMHTIWLREHNRIALGLRAVNPRWTDEILFQETKRIVIAELQNIVYSEFLPLIIGQRAMGIFGLFLPNNISAYTTYDQFRRPGIFNAFATAAYRFGHSLIQNNYQMTGNGEFPLRNAFQNPQVIYQQFSNIDRIMLGFTNQPAQGSDNFVSEAVTNHLFQTPGASFGSDLASLNIQRGRDHGLQTYNNYRQSCEMTRAANFDGLANLFVGGRETVKLFQDSYRSVNDIDLWPAGISEVPLPDGVVGNTFACIIGEQFRRLKDGDRYFFTHGGQAGTFSPIQLANLRQRSMADVICDNASPTVASVQLNAFRQDNNKVACANHNKLNLNNWRAP